MNAIKRVPHCSHWGAYHVLVKGERVVGVEPFEKDPAPSPLIRSVVEWTNPERRILRPLVREGWLKKRERSDGSRRGSDRFVPLGWDEVSQLVAGEIRRVASEHGNSSIFAGSYGWTNCGRFHHAASLLKRMLGFLGGYTGHVDTYSIGAGNVILRHVVGTDSVQATSFATMAANTDVLVVFGAMAPRTAQNEAGGIGRHTLEEHLRQLMARGTKIVLVSPVRDDVPDWVDVEWWPIRPNADAALMLGLAGEIVRAGRHDKAFLDTYTSGADRYLSYLDGSADGTRKDADWASRLTDIDPGRIRWLADQMGRKRSMLSVSWSLQRAHHGEQPYWAALGLACVIGQIGLPGGGISYGYGSLGGVGALVNMGRSPAMPTMGNSAESFIPVARISDMLMNPGKEYTYDGKVRAYPDTRLIYWAGGNPFHHHQDLKRFSQAWARPETIIVQDPAFTPTAQRADIVLPANTSLEHNDLAGNKRSEYIFAMHQAIASIGHSRSDFDIVNSIAERLDIGAQFNEGRNEMEWLRHLYSISRADASARFGFEMPDFDAFWEQGYAECPVSRDHVFMGDFRERPEEAALNTESGKIVLGSGRLEALGYDDCPPHPAWLEPAEWLGATDDPGQFHLISHQPAGRLHSQIESGVASMSLKRNGREQVQINPQDAAALGIASGQTVRLFNGRGACLATAQVTDNVRPRVVVLATGAWFSPYGADGLEIAGNPNVLTLDIPASQFSQGCSAHTCLVRVEPFDDETRDAVLEYNRHLAALLPS